MGDLAEMAALPIEQTINGKHVRFAPLTNRQVAEYEEWAVAQRVRDILADLPGLSAMEKIGVAQQVRSESRLRIVSTEMNGQRGIMRYLLMSAARLSPDLTEEDLLDGMTFDEMMQLQGQIEERTAGPRPVVEGAQNPPAKAPTA